VKVSLFYELSLPRPWEPDSEFMLYENSLRELELADSLGFHAVWVTEHHFQEEKCHLSCPEVLLGALTQRTRNMRLGHGIAQMPPGINHPLRVAERVATLDLLSGGRIDFGYGESSSEAELGGFRIDPGRKRAMVDEAREVAISALADTPFVGFEGEFVTAPPRNVVPKPLQKPHPPLWLACSRRDTISRAAESAVGALAFQFVDPESATQVVQDYYATLTEKGVPIGRAVNANVSFVSFAVCASTTEEAVRRATQNVGFFTYGAKHYAVNGVHQPGVTSLWDGFVNEGRPGSLGASASVGTPDEVRDVFNRFEQAGVDQLSLIVQHGKLPHEAVLETIDLIGTKVLPEFIERDRELSADKQARLSDVIEMVQARAPQPPAAPAGYTFSAPAKAWSGGGEGATEVLEALHGLEGR
jgi:alkanesulfonate monooxygenase SsuD/methylene tetrahydromethanopterin reductase-like flavin-dependent oxidoreductase (luciferase family)